MRLFSVVEPPPAPVPDHKPCFRMAATLQIAAHFFMMPCPCELSNSVQSYVYIQHLALIPLPVGA